MKRNRPVTQTLIQTSIRRGLGRALAIAAAAGLLAACQTIDGETAGQSTAAPKPNHFGSYLAGRFATRQRDAAAASKYFERAVEFEPGNAQLLERLLISEVSKGDLDAAAKTAQDLIKASPEQRLANLVLGIKEFRNGQYPAARGFFEKLDGRALAELGNRFGTAWAHVGEKNTDAAVAIAKGLLGAQGLEAFAIYHKALLEDAGGRDADALQSMALAYKVSKGDSLRVVTHYAEMLERSGAKDKARAVYEAYLKRSPGHPIMEASLARLSAGGAPPAGIATPQQGLAEVFYGVANALNQDTVVDLSVFYVQLSLALNPKDELAITLLGENLQKAGRLQESTEAFSRIAKGSPVYPNAQIQIGSNLAREKKPEEAVRVLTAALTGTPRDVETHQTIGDTLREVERYAEAEQAYSKAVALIGKPLERHWVLFYTRGIARERVKRWSDAEADLQQALQLKPEQPLVMNYLAYTWIEHGVNADKALEMLHRAVELREDDGFIVDSLGWAYYRRGDYAKAVKYLEAAASLEPGEATINDHLGDAYWKVGRQLEARFQWERALTLKPEPDEAAKIQAKLDKGLDGIGAVRAAAPVTQ